MVQTVQICAAVPETPPENITEADEACAYPCVCPRNGTNTTLNATEVEHVIAWNVTPPVYECALVPRLVRTCPEQLPTDGPTDGPPSPATRVDAEGAVHDVDVV